MRNEGAVTLARLALRQREIARALGVTQPAVCQWIACQKRPSYRLRKKLAAVYAIPIDAWDIEVSAAA